MIYHVHAQVSKHKIPQNELLFLGCKEAELIFLVCLKISSTDPVCVCAECPLGNEVSFSAMFPYSAVEQVLFLSTVSKNCSCHTLGFPD